MLSQQIDQSAFDKREDNTIVASSDEQLNWLCQQLVAWPRRVDETKTCNIKFLMLSAARTIAHQAAQLAEYENQFGPITA